MFSKLKELDQQGHRGLIVYIPFQMSNKKLPHSNGPPPSPRPPTPPIEFSPMFDALRGGGNNQEDSNHCRIN